MRKEWSVLGDMYIGTYEDNIGIYEIILRDERCLMIPFDKEEVTDADIMVLPINELVEWLSLPHGKTKSYYSMETEYGWNVGIEISLLHQVNIKIHSMYCKTEKEGNEKFLDLVNMIYKLYHKAVFIQERITNPFENNIVIVMGTIDYVDQLPTFSFNDDMVRCYIVRYEGTSKENKMIPWDREFFYFKKQWLTYGQAVEESMKKGGTVTS